jgi:hypothetical protein
MHRSDKHIIGSIEMEKILDVRIKVICIIIVNITVARKDVVRKAMLAW